MSSEGVEVFEGVLCLGMLALVCVHVCKFGVCVCVCG
jgi:hypothetical protein